MSAGDDARELEALRRIDETAVELQQRGEYMKALECMERGLVLRQHFFGADSDEVWQAAKVVGEMCNLLAMTYLQQEDFKMVIELLKKAEILTERDEAGRAVTYNNFACYYRRKGKLHAALQYLQRALRIESKLQHVDNPADTHLNMCAVLSQLGRHAQALEHAQSALILLQEEIFAPGPDGRPPTEEELANKTDRLAVLGIAYHNIGVEQEFLHKFSATLQSYRKGVEIARRYLGDSHGITITLRNSFLSARRALAKRGTLPKHEMNRTGGASAGALGSTGMRGTRRSAGDGAGGGGGKGRRAPKGHVSSRDERRWGEISGAYGDPDGVIPVVADRGGSGGGGGGGSESSRMMGGSGGRGAEMVDDVDDATVGSFGHGRSDGAHALHALITPRGGEDEAEEASGAEEAEAEDGTDFEAVAAREMDESKR